MVYARHTHKLAHKKVHTYSLNSLTCPMRCGLDVPSESHRVDECGESGSFYFLGGRAYPLVYCRGETTATHTVRPQSSGALPVEEIRTAPVKPQIRVTHGLNDNMSILKRQIDKPKIDTHKKRGERNSYGYRRIKTTLLSSGSNQMSVSKSPRSHDHFSHSILRKKQPSMYRRCVEISSSWR